MTDHSKGHWEQDLTLTAKRRKKNSGFFPPFPEPCGRFPPTMNMWPWTEKAAFALLGVMVGLWWCNYKISHSELPQPPLWSVFVTAVMQLCSAMPRYLKLPSMAPLQTFYSLGLHPRFLTLWDFVRVTLDSSCVKIHLVSYFTKTLQHVSQSTKTFSRIFFYFFFFQENVHTLQKVGIKGFHKL